MALFCVRFSMTADMSPFSDTTSPGKSDIWNEIKEEHKTACQRHSLISLET